MYFSIFCLSCSIAFSRVSGCSHEFGFSGTVVFWGLFLFTTTGFRMSRLIPAIIDSIWVVPVQREIMTPLYLSLGGVKYCNGG